MERLNKTISEAAHGQNRAAAATFSQARIQLYANGHLRDAADILPELADGFMHTASAADRAKIAQLLGGKSAQEALPFLLGIVLFLFGFGGLAASLWPYVVPRSATIWTGAADETTLRFLGVGVVVILPIVLAYLGHAYWIFRGKTAIGHGYGEDTEAPIGATWRRRRSSSLETDLHLS